MSFVEEGDNYCVQCGVNMGATNNRQLCGRTFCYGRCKILIEANKEIDSSNQSPLYSHSDSDEICSESNTCSTIQNKGKRKLLRKKKAGHINKTRSDVMVHPRKITSK